MSERSAAEYCAVVGSKYPAPDPSARWTFGMKAFKVSA